MDADWLNQDWEYEALLDLRYQGERELIEQELLNTPIEKKVAKIIMKKDDTKYNKTSFRGGDKKGIQLRCNLSSNINKRKNRH